MDKNKIEQRKERREEKKSRRIPLKKYTKGGKTASVIGLFNIMIIVFSIMLSISQKGKAGVYVGVMMLLAMVFAIIGFTIGINSFKEENKFLRYTYLGTITNAVIWIFILGMYLTYV